MKRGACSTNESCTRPKHDSHEEPQSPRKVENSELILNSDGSIYHLGLFPEDVGDLVFTVGDPDRVDVVSSYFDTVELRKRKRELCTHTGILNGKRVSVISSGMGTDNIDIMLNELDALVNIDFKTKLIKSPLKQLSVIRLGTSGASQPDISIGSLVVSSRAVGFDNLMHFYKNGPHLDSNFSDALKEHLKMPELMSYPYVTTADQSLVTQLTEHNNNTTADSKSYMRVGITATNSGFYGPQCRCLRAPLRFPSFMDSITSFSYTGPYPSPSIPLEQKEQYITNFDMETAALLGLAQVMGHKATAVNVILANRTTGVFLENTKDAIDHMIQVTLDIMCPKCTTSSGIRLVSDCVQNPFRFSALIAGSSITHCYVQNISDDDYVVDSGPTEVRRRIQKQICIAIRKSFENEAGGTVTYRRCRNGPVVVFNVQSMDLQFDLVFENSPWFKGKVSHPSNVGFHGNPNLQGGVKTLKILSLNNPKKWPKSGGIHWQRLALFFQQDRKVDVSSAFELFKDIMELFVEHSFDSLMTIVNSKVGELDQPWNVGTKQFRKYKTNAGKVLKSLNALVDNCTADDIESCFTL